jgi:hypothetical protein
MSVVQKVLVGSTQTIISHPRVMPSGAFLRRQATSAEVKIVTPAQTDSAFSACTVQAYSTTLTAAASEGDTELSVTATTGWVDGRRYLADIEGDTSIEITARAKTLNGSSQPTVLKLAEGLPRALVNGTAIKSFAISQALTADQTDEPGNAVARFKAVVDGVTYEWDEPFRIVRRFLHSTLTATRLTQFYPIIRGLRSSEDEDFNEVLEVAWEAQILPLLELRGVDPEWVQNVDALDPLYALACVLHLARPNPGFPRETLASLETRWTQEANDLFARRSWYAAPPAEEPAPTPEGGAPELSYSRQVR